MAKPKKIAQPKQADKHTWERVSLDGGSCLCSVWRCTKCEATNSADPDYDEVVANEQFLACGCGPEHTKLPEDCEKAGAWIKKHKQTCPNARCARCRVQSKLHTTRLAPGACDAFQHETLGNIPLKATLANFGTITLTGATVNTNTTGNFYTLMMDPDWFRLP